MRTVGGTGHQQIPEAAVDYVSKGVNQVLAEFSFDLAYTCLAVGADQLIANEAAKLGINLAAVIPSSVYEDSFSGNDLLSYRSLLSRATLTVPCNYQENSEEAYWAAGKVVVDSCDVLIAVWDGKRSRGLGGTGDVVAYAESSGKPVRVVWPTGLRRP